MITVQQRSSGDPLVFDVDLDGTRFEVTLARGDLDRLGAGRSAIEAVTAAFWFLLDREPKGGDPQALRPQRHLSLFPRV